MWPGHLLCGAQELLTGIPGVGKSQIQSGYIACATNGLPWPDGAPAIAPMNVIMITAEDALDDTVVPRLVAANADTRRVYFLKYIKIDKMQRHFLLAEDLDQLELEITKIGGVGFVTIDPITAYMGGKIDSHKTTQVRSQLAPLKDLAERLRITVSTITHPAKNAGQRAIDQFIGSQAFIAAGRVGHVCIEEQGDDGPTGRFLFAHAKHSGSVRMPTLAYRIEQIVIGTDRTEKNIADVHVVWAEQPVNITANAAVAAMAREAKDTGALDEAKAFLLGKLESGPQPATEVLEHARALMISTRTLERAKSALHVVVVKEPTFQGKWTWALPPSPL